MLPDKRSEVPARMWDEDSPMPNVLTMTTGDRQDGERTYVAVDALLTESANIAAGIAVVDFKWGARGDHMRCGAAAIRAAIAHATEEASDAH